MKSELFYYASVSLFSVFIASVSQIMLKKSALKVYKKPIDAYLNPLVIFAYLLFFGCTFITIYALKVIPLSLGAILESTGYIFVTLLSYIFLKERVSKRQFLGICLIIIGVIIFSLKIK